MNDTRDPVSTAAACAQLADRPKKRRAPRHHVDKTTDPVGGQTQSAEVTGLTEPPPIPGVAVSEGLDPHTPPTAN